MKQNCINCGALLHYDETSYGKLSKCKYCGTEYHIDMLGRVEEYKVKLKLYNKIIYCYVNSITVQPPEVDTFRTIDGKCHRYVLNSNPQIELNLFSYDMEDIGDSNE